MNYSDVLANARQCIGKYCKACPVCNGVACKNQIPGPGAKGVGDTAIRNYNKWADIRVNMDTLCENGTPDTHVELFGRSFKYPFFAGPVGAVNLHYSDTYTDMTYNDVLVRACAESSIAAFTGDGTNPDVMTMATKAIGNADGCGVPTIKPWNIDTIKEKMAQAKASGCFAVAMDVDAAGLPFLKNMTPPAGSKSVAELAEIVKLAERPFIVKGVMTVKGALKAKEAGAAAIVVSNHGGRVLDQCPATAEVLPEIAAALKDTGVKVLVDGGIRTGVDVFKALALGADGVLIGRPFVTAVYGGGAVRAAYKQAELGYDIALCDEEFTQLDVRYAAEYTYWNLSAMELYAASMRQYVNIIRSLKEVVDRRFAEGYIAKGDVLMIDARLSEAQYGLVSAEQNYTVALHNFNILRGTDPDLAVELAQGIRDSLPQPVRVLPDEVLGRRPDYMAARLRSEQADAGIRAARAPFNPQLSVGVGGMWQPYYPNSTGATTVDGSAFVKLTLPIFHWGERRRATGAARAVQRQSEWNTALLHDNIVRDEMNGWTALVNSRAQVDATEQSLRIAGENLDISTYSYGEGLSTILDVLQAQLSWIQLYTNAIKAHYNYAVAVSDYLRITAQ